LAEILQQILEIGRQKENAYDPGSVFQFVNFSDHNLFFLTSDGPASPIIESALEKVASLSSYGNPFCQAHGEYCSGCPAKCPIKLNYELLRDPQIRKKVSELLIQCIVKHHHIVSIRALYNFIFDLIVPVELDGLNPDEIMGWVQKSSSDAYLQALFINHLFEHPEISRTFEHLHHLDPALRRSLFLDDQIISLITREDPAGMLATLGAAPALSETLVEHARTVKNHDALVKTYVRLMFFASSDAKGGHFDDIAYAEFMRLLYCWHTGERAELKKLYKLIHRATMTWSGKAPEGEMLLEVGNQQLKYRLSEKVTIKPIQLPPEKSDDKIVRKFSCILPLQFRTDDDAPKELTLTVDCRLYEMACKVDAGYRANQADKSNFIAFTSFTNDVMETGGLGTHLRITETETGEFFVLELDEFGDFTFRGD
jgi:DNA phosphorothioation-dependent restriction protein DptF